MKKVIGKNQVIITSLAILIAVAGYLNFADVDLGFRDKEASTDSSSILEDAGYDLTDETALLDENQADGGLTDNSLTDSQETDTPGEAVFTGSTGFAAQAKISREQVRSQNKADLQDIINNEEIDDEEKQEAIHTMVSMTDLSEKEAAAELLLEAKGFKNVVVNLTGETAGRLCLRVLQDLPHRQRSAENRCAHRTRQICRTLSIMKKLMMKRSRRQYIRWSR